MLTLKRESNDFIANFILKYSYDYSKPNAIMHVTDEGKPKITMYAIKIMCMTVHMKLALPAPDYRIRIESEADWQ